MPKVIAMIPARLGSQRLKEKNLLDIGGVPMIVRAMRKVRELSCFAEVWVNSDADLIAEYSQAENVNFHRRPAHLASNTATSEEFVAEFLEHHPCDYLVQVHSIAPLLSVKEIEGFVQQLVTSGSDTLLSGVNEQIQCLLQGRPLNFSFDGMDATQELEPVQRISWSLTGWRAATYLENFSSGRCATFGGQVGFFPLTRLSGMVVKQEEDYRIVKALAETLAI